MQTEARVEQRKSRADESRRLEERINELSSLTFAPDISVIEKIMRLAPEGWSYGLIRCSVYGEPDSRINEQYSMGWTPVPADRHPGLFFNDLVGKREPNGYIEYKGAIVCERPTLICNKEQEAYRRKTAKQTNTVVDADKFMSDPLMRATFLVNPELTRSNIATPGR